MEPDVAGDRIHLLIVFELQIDDAAFAERGDALAGLRVEGDHLIAGRDVDDSRRAAIGPIREAAARQLTRCFLTALALVDAVHPLHLTRRGVERHNCAARARGCVEHAADHQRRRLEVELRPRAEVVGLEAPCHFERAEVRRADLIERRIASARQGRAVGPPLAVRWRRLGQERRCQLPTSNSQLPGRSRAPVKTSCDRDNSQQSESRLRSHAHRGHTVPCSRFDTAFSPLYENFCTRFPS